MKLPNRLRMFWVLKFDTTTVERVVIGVFFTGVTLLNHTLEDILTVAKQDADIAVIGPTASRLPDAMFARGVRVVGGVLVKKPDELLDVLAAGGSGYHFFGSLAPRIVIENQL